MNIKDVLHKLVLVGCLLLFTGRAAAEASKEEWLGRSWEFSYVIQIDNLVGMKSLHKLGQTKLARGNDFEMQIAAAIFDWQTLSVPDPQKVPYPGDGRIAVLPIRFDQTGLVQSPYRWQPGLKANIDSIYKIVLTEGGSTKGLRFDLGYWYTGANSEALAYTPAVCSLIDMEDRYRKGFNPNGYSDGNFGCREWGYYLQSPEHPYIDITSYQKQGAYIRPVVGWGRFDVPAKPVIGKVLDTWLCLYDCPDNEAPGVIPDIRTWAGKRGWPVPKPPKRLPMFVDVPRKPGEFVD